MLKTPPGKPSGKVPSKLCHFRWTNINIIGCIAVDRQFTYIFVGPGEMEANGCVQRLDLAEISVMSMLKLKNDVKSASRLRMCISA